MDALEEFDEDERDDDPTSEPSDRNPWPLGFPARRHDPLQNRVVGSLDMETGVARDEALSRAYGERVLAMVALQQLFRQGMKAMPNVENGGFAWVLQTLNDIASSGLFGEQAGPQSADTLIGPMGTFEGQYVQESKQASLQFSKSDVKSGNFLDGFIGQAIRAVAFGGAATATAFGLSKGLRGVQGPRFGGGNSALRAGRGRKGRSGGRGNLRIFPAPTFRPGFARRRVGSRFLGNPPTD